MNTWLKALATAFIFLTRLPMPALQQLTPEDQGRSLLCFPMVGAVIGLLMWLLASSLLNTLSPLLLAAVLTAFWAAITGGLHLDGLADSADGWLAGKGNVERSLKIMHDSRCGSGALVTVVCVLIVKFAALTVVIQQQLWPLLFIAPIIGRCIAPLLFIPGGLFYAPYVQPSGIARHFIDHCPPIAPRLCLLVVVGCSLLTGSVSAGLLLIFFCALTLWLLRRMMMDFLGGSTGDTAGASTEIIETVVLISGGVLLSTATAH